MEAFATVEDLQLGWKTLTEAEQAVAGELLLRATAKILGAGLVVDASDEVQAMNLKTVTCDMVRRAMNAGTLEGIASASQTIGSSTASLQISNPDGALYISRKEEALLGIRGGRIGWAGTVEWSELCS